MYKSLIEWAVALLRERRLAGSLLLGMIALMLLGELIRGPRYTSHATFLPQGAGAAGGLAGLASQLGFDLQSGAPGQSPPFYVDLVNAEPFLEDLVREPYRIQGSDSMESISLLEVYGASGDTPAEILEDGAGSLADDIVLRQRREAGTVEVSVRSTDPALSQAVSQRLLAQVTEFDIKSRSSQVGAERSFVEGRLRAAADELRQAEDRARSFLERNRSFRDSPQLTFEFERLQRELSLRQQISATLTEAYERARIEEVRNTPVVTIVAAPSLPATPDSRQLPVKLILIMVVWLGLLAGRLQIRQLVGESMRKNPDAWNRLRSELGPRISGVVSRLMSESVSG